MISKRTTGYLIVSMADKTSALELINTINELTAALNQLTLAYTALAAQLDTDSGVAEDTYGTGTETPPTLVP